MKTRLVVWKRKCHKSEVRVSGKWVKKILFLDEPFK